ncbi:MAG: response regulator, partial [Thermodesulfobacteriota bacterium]
MLPVLMMGQNRIGSLSFEVAKRILHTLEERVAMKKTPLATATGLNYKVSTKYINMLKVLGWIEVRNSGDSEHISITDLGREVNARLLDNATVSAVQNRISYAQPTSIQGSEVRFDRPLAGEKAVKTSSSAGPPTRDLLHIMLVDDEPDILLTFQSYLVQRGYDVKAFSDAYGALREFAKMPSHFDVVVLDIRMPDLNGLQLYQSIKAMNPSAKVLFVTAVDAAQEICSVLPG